MARAPSARRSVPASAPPGAPRPASSSPPSAFSHRPRSFSRRRCPISRVSRRWPDSGAEPGIGYVLRAGYTLPPLMFTDEEIEAVVLGSRMVAGSTDARLARAARDALAKVTAVLPEEKRDSVEALGLLAAPRRPLAPDGVDLALLRSATRAAAAC